MTEFLEVRTAETSGTWDEALLGFADVNYQQTWAHGEIDRTGSARVRRFVLQDGSDRVVMAQTIVREPMHGVCIATIRRGPVYRRFPDERRNLRHLRAFLDSLIEKLQAEYQVIYLNVLMTVERNPDTELAVREAGLTRPAFERAPFLTYVVELPENLEEAMRALGGKWRNQLRRAQELGPAWTWSNDDTSISRYARLHNEMCLMKGMSNYSMDEADFRRMRDLAGDSVVVLVGAHEGVDACGCLVFIGGSTAFYAYAAANQRGRDGYLSNAMVWELMRRLRDRGVKTLDMAGIDPVANYGGYHFKKEMGGRAVAYLGEWVFASPRWLKIPMDALLAWRTSRLYR